MLDEPPFPAEAPTTTAGDDELAVIVPTRNRAAKLARCLEALAGAREQTAFRVYVCDSSGAEDAAGVAELCRGYEFAELVSHDRNGASAARNVGTRACGSRLVVSIDDDVYVEPGAIEALLAAYRRSGEGSVVAGCVRWSHWHSRPMMMRRIGFGREALAGEDPEFVVSALILYPRQLGLEFPWNERLWPYDDRYVSLVWKAAGAELVYAPDACADHDEIHTEYPVGHEADRIYVNLLDATMVNRGVGRALDFEFLSFAACAKKWARTPRGAWGLIRAWTRGHLALLRDRRELRATIAAAKRRRRAMP